MAYDTLTGGNHLGTVRPADQEDKHRWGAQPENHATPSLSEGNSCKEKLF